MIDLYMMQIWVLSQEKETIIVFVGNLEWRESS